jgi:hypothetical protein
MEEKSASTSSGFENGFMWLATVLGFIVDTVTLIGLFSTFEVKDVPSHEMPSSVHIPKIRIATASPELKDITFVLIVFSLFMLMLYIGNAFYKKESPQYEDESMLGYDDDYNDYKRITPSNKNFPLLFSVFGTSFLSSIFMLWIFVFYFQDSVLWENIYFVFSVWITGTFLSLWMISMRSLENNKMNKFFKTSLLVFAYSLLPLGLIVEWLFGTTLFHAIITIVQVIFLSVAYTIVLYLLTALLSGITWVVVKWYYSIS